MPRVTADGIETRYERHGEGPTLLMFAPGGFDANLQRWSTGSTWRAMRAMEVLPRRFTTIIYDRRESGDSGGRIETLSWAGYARQARDLLHQIGEESAIVLGACMGCSIATAFAAAYPEATRSVILHWPVGGHVWNEMGHERFGEAIRFARTAGMPAVAERAAASASFWSDPASGPWASCAARDAGFARQLAETPVERYLAFLRTSELSLFGGDLIGGVHASEIQSIRQPVLIVPGGDEVHTRSSAYAIGELLANVELWDVPVASQESVELLRRISAFRDATAGASS